MTIISFNLQRSQSSTTVHYPRPPPFRLCCRTIAFKIPGVIYRLYLHCMCHCAGLRSPAKVDPITLIASRSKVVRLFSSTTSEEGSEIERGRGLFRPWGDYGNHAHARALPLSSRKPHRSWKLDFATLSFSTPGAL